MNFKDYDNHSADLLAYAQGIQTSKRPGYTAGSEDVLKNFKRVGDRLGVSPEVAWGVYFLKHVDAITTAMTQPALPVSEELKGRFADAINYLLLGYGLFMERPENQPYRAGSNQARELVGAPYDRDRDNPYVHERNDPHQ